MFDFAYKLEEDLRLQRMSLESLSFKYETQRLKTAMYYSFHMRNWELGERLQKQLQENTYASIGEFDGFSYSSVRANAMFRTLEDMVENGLITIEEYKFCNV